MDAASVAAIMRVARLLLAAIVLLPDGGAFAADAQPKAIARVNGDVVTEQDTQRLLANPVVRRQLQSDLGLSARHPSDLQRQAVRKLIEQKLLLQEARRRNLTVSEQELDRALVDLRRRFGDLKAFGVWMKMHAVDDTRLLDVLRDELLIKQAADALIKGVRISEQDVQAYYESHADDFASPGQFRLQIMVAPSKEAAERLLMDVQLGADFGGLARAGSLGTRAARGGDTGWVGWNDIPPALREIVRGLKIGQTGGPVGSGTDYRLVRLAGHRPGAVKPLSEVRRKVERRALAEKQQRVYRQWLADEEKKANVEWLV